MPLSAVKNQPFEFLSGSFERCLFNACGLQNRKNIHLTEEGFSTNDCSDVQLETLLLSTSPL